MEFRDNDDDDDCEHEDGEDPWDESDCPNITAPNVRWMKRARKGQYANAVEWCLATSYRTKDNGWKSQTCTVKHLLAPAARELFDEAQLTLQKYYEKHHHALSDSPCQQN